MNIFKKITSAILLVSLMLSVTACSAKNNDEPVNDTPLFTAGNQAEITQAVASTKYKAGDLVHFGEYPSSLVPENVEAELNKLTLEWKYFDYYSGDGTVGSMTKSSYMKYADVTYNGQKYRAVQIIEYRPEATYKKTAVGEISVNGKKPQQAVNTFELNKTYWFIYQPLVWRVLDPEKGLLICENIIDAQPYSNTVYQSGEDYYSDPSFTKLAYDYENSSVRQWLNNDSNGFYNVAFTDAEKKLIKEVEVKNTGEYNFGYESYKAEPTKEKIYLLSLSESEKEEYGLDTEAFSTFYAWIQGAEIEYNYATGVIGQSTWITRTPSRVSMMVCQGGVNSSGEYVYTSACGIRPAVQLSNLDNLEAGKDVMKEAMEK